MHKMDETQVNLIQLTTFELELDFAQYIQFTDVRIAYLCRAPYIPSTELRHNICGCLLCLYNLQPNRCFLARLVSDNSISLEKFELGALSSPATPKEKILHGVRVLVHGYLCVSFDLPSSINFRYINGFPELEAQNHY